MYFDKSQERVTVKDDIISYLGQGDSGLSSIAQHIGESNRKTHEILLGMASEGVIRYPADGGSVELIEDGFPRDFL